ncbi:hypothetical protein [Nesterenkonia flava]|uniref:Uncharacterized protein n=1 Tax=Nesterenkonia flava TaxID=469799 RepID=A0ABU1FRC7_9MICC|nr:hypothetical protein [Nesterenkonia flava]MDR5711194.1 hypothetical protein [Nesterenkonia flava]
MTNSPEIPDVETQLARILLEAEESIAELRHELVKIQQERMQHEEVDKLEEHLAAATVRWSEIRVFFRLMLQELRGGRADAGQEEER